MVLGDWPRAPQLTKTDKCEKYQGDLNAQQVNKPYYNVYA